jgi:hypothetical protein
MASWKKVIVSGSDASLLSVTTSGNIIATGSLAANSTVKFPGLTNVSQASIVGIDPATGQLFYQGTGSFTANSASYAVSASLAQTASFVTTAETASFVANAVSASRATSAANADNATSASYALTASFALNVPLTASNADTASYALFAVSASRATSAANADNADNATSSSYALSASYAPGSDTSISASYALSASYAQTASYAINATTAATASSVSTLNQPVVISGSFSQSGSVFLTSLTEISKSYVVGYDSTTGQLTYQTAVDNADTASFAVSASNAISSSLAQTASFVTTAQTASYVENAQTASFVLNAISSSLATTNLFTASVSNNIVTFTKGDGTTFNLTVETGSATNTVSASFATSASLAQTASYVENAVSASRATSAANADNATSASYALTASFAISSSHAAFAISASHSQTSTGAQVAQTASRAVTAADADNSTLFNSLSSSQFPQLVQNNTFTGNNVFGNITASNAQFNTASIAYLNVVYETASIIYSSGSNQFGDASDDVQTLYGTVDIKTGPLLVTGSLNVSGGITGSFSGTASFATDALSSSLATTNLYTASVSSNVVTFTKGDGTTFNLTVATGSGTNIVSASFATSASLAQTASYVADAVSASRATSAANADNATSASYALTASFALNVPLTASNANTASYAFFAVSSSLAETASFVTTAQTASFVANAVSASRATSAANADNATSASYAVTASYVLDKTIVTGSNATFTQPTPATTWVFNHMLNDQFPVFQVFNASNQVIIPTSITADNNITATITFSVPTAGTAIASIGGFTGSAPTVFSASYAATASSVDTLNQPVVVSGSFSQAGSVFLTTLTEVSKSYVVGYDETTGQLTYQTAVDNAATASFAVSASNAITSSYAISSSNAVSSSYAISSSLAQTASFVLNAVSSSFAGSGNGTFSGSFSGSFAGDGAGLTNVPASGIVGLQLNQIASGSVTASIAPDLGFRVNTNSQITGSLIVSSNINSAGNVVATGVDSSLTGSFTGSFAGNFVGTSNLPDLTQGTGISAFTYDGSTTATVAVSGAAALTSGSLTKWSGNAFVNSSITDLGNVTINNAGGVLVQTGGLYVTGSSTFHDNLFVEGNLTVNGTASFQNSQNLAIADQFILLNSGSSTFQDSGFVINTGNTGNSGSAWFLETAGTTTGAPQNGRFAVAGGVSPDATTVTAEEYANTTKIVASAPGNAVPQFGGSGLGQGNMWVDTTNGDIFIYA